jgi:putative hydrolase of the HAD superfamily
MIRYILFDLDETLYPASNGLMPAVSERMREYIARACKLSPEEAHELQMRYWDEYGTTLRGLYEERQVDPQDYLAFVHDVDVSKYVHPDPRLRSTLEQIPYARVIVTNADVPHAERVLERLGVADLFEDIFDIVFMAYICKPARGAYEAVLERLGVAGSECILVEDAPRNLAAARELGIKTILVGNPECPTEANACIAQIYDVGEAIAGLAKESDLVSI